jgi:hypothetical protein
MEKGWFKAEFAELITPVDKPIMFWFQQRVSVIK